MKKQITILLALAITAPVFALPSFNPEGNVEKVAVVEKVLQDKAPVNNTVTGTLVEGSFSTQNLQNTTFQDKALGLIVVFSANKGNIEYRAVSGKKVTGKVSVKKVLELPNGDSADPHASVEVYAEITAPTAKSVSVSRILVLTTEKQALNDSPVYTAPTNTVEKDANGNCAKCGAADPYHCGAGSIGPCEKKAAQKVPTKVITVYEKNHLSGCVDPLHCDCPETARKVTVQKEEVEVKIHSADCKDQYHCDCPTKTEYR